MCILANQEQHAFRLARSLANLLAWVILAVAPRCIWAQSGNAPVVPPNSVVNDASFANGTVPLAPGTIAAIFGSNLDDGSANASSSFGSNGRLLSTLGGATVTFNGTISAPLVSAFPGQLNVQIPLELAKQTSASVQVTVGGKSSPPQTVPIGAFSLGIFTIPSGGKGQGAIQISNTATFAAPQGSIPGAQAGPVNPGQSITIFCTGLGAVTDPPATGAPALSNPLSTTLTTPQVTIGGIPANVSFSGLAPGFVGLYQVNVQVPAGVAGGDAIPLVLSIGGVQSNTVTIAVSVRRPRGIYAVVIVNEHIAAQKSINPAITAAQLHTYFSNLYTSLLKSAAVSGLAIEIQWRMLNPNPPTSTQPYDWSFLDDAFNSVAAWNTQNPGAPAKTIQVTVSPGYNSPQWLLDQIPSCDGLFQSPPQTPPSNCGKATFSGFVEGGGGMLPLPWNPIYKSAWKTFLIVFAAQYQSNPAFVSIDVAGPSAASTETILPDNANTSAQVQFGGILPNDMWLRVLAQAYPGQPAYQKSDQAFIDEWNAAIDTFGQIFQGVTLILWAEPGLPNLASSGFTVPNPLKFACPVVNMDCAAVTTILTHFMDPKVGGSNAKGVSEAGMTAIDFVGNLGPAAAKQLAQNTATLSSPSAQILAGQQFAHSTANYPLQEGCTSLFPPDPKSLPTGCNIPPSCTVTTFSVACLPVTCIPQACLAPGTTIADLATFTIYSNVPRADLISTEQGIYNVLRKYFDGTPPAALFGGTVGTEPLNYLQIYSEDIQYAAAHANSPVPVIETGGTSVVMAAQDLLNLASQELLEISEPPLP